MRFENVKNDINVKNDTKLVIGYVRISTEKQSMERQIRNIKTLYPDAAIAKEIFTGTKIDRPVWDKLYRMVKQNKVETIIFDSVSRMSRSKEEGSSIYLDLFRRGIKLVFLKEPYLNTEEYKMALERQISIQLQLEDKATEQFVNGLFSTLNTYITALATRQVELAFEQAEKEVADLRQRTKEGLLSAKLRGSQIGRVKGSHYPTKKSFKAKKIIKKKSVIFGGTLNNAECIKLCGIARTTFYRYTEELQKSS